MEIGGLPLDASAVAASLLANVAPPSEASAAAAGTALRASRMDHVHERISWSGYAATSAGGVAVFDFSGKPYTNQPVPVLGYVETAANAQPVILRVSKWTMSGSQYVGCEVTAQRATTIPTNLVTALLGGVFNLFQGSAANVQVSLLLIPQS